MHGRDLRVTHCAFETPGVVRAPATFEQVGAHGVAKVTLPRALGPGRATLHFAWGRPVRRRRAGGLFRSRPGPTCACSPNSARSTPAARFGIRRAAVQDDFDVSLTVPAALVVSNEQVLEEVALPGGAKHVRFAATRPLPTYLLFVAAGPFEIVERPLPPNEVRSRTLPVRGIAPRGRGRELAFALETAGALLANLERWFDMPFPYGKLDHVAAGEYPGARRTLWRVASTDAAYEARLPPNRLPGRRSEGDDAR